MSEKRLRIAVISDLHCDPSNEKDTYLTTDKLRTPANDHPVESLLEIINKDKLTVDLTLCPGDFTNKSNKQGFISGWGFSIEISQKLKSKDIIATIGNHDVDVYGTSSNYSFTNAKGIKRDFPIKDENKRDIFWSKGCTFVEEDEYRILVINSSHFHHNEASSHVGEISDDGIQYIKDYLNNLNDDKIQIALSHYPPVSHPRNKLGEDDKILGGEDLLNILGENNFDLFIYGHKHDPFIKYHNTTVGNNRLTLFSSGSFSAGTNLMFTSTRNSFHIIDIFKVNKKSKGKISTWTFKPNDGWKIFLDESAFAPISGFGNEKSVDEIFESVDVILKDKNQLTWEEITSMVDDINNLIPEDSKKLHELFRKNNYQTDEHLWKGPSKIYNLKKLLQ